MAQIASHPTKNGFLQKQAKGVERQALLVCAATVGGQTNKHHKPPKGTSEEPNPGTALLIHTQTPDISTVQGACTSMIIAAAVTVAMK